MIELYESLIERCATMNLINLTHVSLANTLTPPEMLTLWRQMREKAPLPHPQLTGDRNFTLEQLHKAESVWINGLRSDFHLSGKDRPEPFLRRQVRNNATLYSSDDGAGGKALVIGLTGGSQRLMMPTPTFLQSLDAGRQDLLLLRDNKRSGYRVGIEGIADTLDGVAEALPRIVDFGAYAGVHAIGCSAGGLPALLIGLRLGLDATVAVGASGPGDPRWNVPGQPNVRDAIMAANAMGATRHITIAYGAQEARDRQAAEALGALVPQARIVGVSVPGQDVMHVVLHPLVVCGAFAPFLREHLRIDV